jgi:hypothetical protein
MSCFYRSERKCFTPPPLSRISFSWCRENCTIIDFHFFDTDFISFSRDRLNFTFTYLCQKLNDNRLTHSLLRNITLVKGMQNVSFIIIIIFFFTSMPVLLFHLLVLSRISLLHLNLMNHLILFTVVQSFKCRWFTFHRLIKVFSFFFIVKNFTQQHNIFFLL